MSVVRYMKTWIMFCIADIPQAGAKVSMVGRPRLNAGGSGVHAAADSATRHGKAAAVHGSRTDAAGEAQLAGAPADTSSVVLAKAAAPDGAGGAGGSGLVRRAAIRPLGNGKADINPDDYPRAPYTELYDQARPAPTYRMHAWKARIRPEARCYQTCVPPVGCLVAVRFLCGAGREGSGPSDNHRFTFMQWLIVALKFATTHCAVCVCCVVQAGTSWPPGGLQAGEFFYYGQKVGTWGACSGRADKWDRMAQHSSGD